MSRVAIVKKYALRPHACLGGCGELQGGKLKNLKTIGILKNIEDL